MGYYAQGQGIVTLNKELTEPEKAVVIAAVEEEFDVNIDIDKARAVCKVYLYPNSEKYREDEVIECLDKLASTGWVADGDIEYIGEDGLLWRFHYVPQHGFIIQEGRVVYDD